MSHRYTKLKPNPQDRFYVDPDVEHAGYGVFGTESGFCYGLYSDRDEADKDALERTQTTWPGET